MAKQPTEKRSAFEESLLKVMAAIDNQVAREMQRTPAEREEHGVQKWEPYQKRIEIIVTALLNALGDQEIQLDSVLVFSQALSKTLLLVIEDLGADGLGKLRAAYCREAAERIASDTDRALKMLKSDDTDLM